MAMNILYYIIILFISASAFAVLSKKITYIISALGSVWLIYLAISGSLSDYAFLPYFLLLSSIVWLSASVYSIGYDHYGKRLASTFALTIASMLLILVSRDALSFLIGWEGMTIASFLAISARKDSMRAAYVFLAFGELSTMLLMLSFALALGTTHSIFFSAWKGSNMWDIIFLFALFGFAVKMAIFPFHIWLPPAHSTAPSNMSALLSAVLTLMGVYGIVMMLSIQVPSVWVSAIMLILGGITAAIGSLHAATSEKVKELPAYSTIENDGIIFVLLGAYIIAVYHHNSVLSAFTMLTVLFYAFFHSISKALLFFTAGLVEKFSPNLNELKDVKLSDISVTSGYIAALSLAAIPPLPGFIAEWMALEALFQSFQIPSVKYKILIVSVGAVVALAAGIATISMTKMISYSFKRSAGRKISIVDAGMLILLSVILIISVFPQSLIDFVSQPVYSLTGVNPVVNLIGGALAIPKGFLILSGEKFGGMSPTFVFVFLIVLVSLIYGISKRKIRYTEAWAGGGEGGNYNSLSYSMILRYTLKGFYRTREEGCRVIWGDIFEKGYVVTAKSIRDASNIFRLYLMNGNIGVYILYIVTAMFLTILYVTGGFPYVH